MPERAASAGTRDARGPASVTHRTSALLADHGAALSVDEKRRPSKNAHRSFDLVTGKKRGTR